MRVFIVHAHPEPTSFNGALTREAVDALTKAGHDTIVSDLHAMAFQPVADRRNFTTVSDPRRFRQQSEEVYANAHGGFARDIQAEMDKLAWCDAMIFQFPIFWLGLPAILKGWVDRVLAAGHAYGGGRYFDRGVFRGKRALCSVTVGGPSGAYSEGGAYGPISAILFPIHHGIFNFVGFSVVEPFVVYEPVRLAHEARLEQLARYRELLLSLDTAPTLPGLNTADYDGLVARRSTPLQSGGK